ncbi:MAG: hypothetical protein WBL91_11065, partial [Pseudolabrys sp.]
VQHQFVVGSIAYAGSVHDYVSDVDAVRSLALWIKQRVRDWTRPALDADQAQCPLWVISGHFDEATAHPANRIIALPERWIETTSCSVF